MFHLFKTCLAVFVLVLFWSVGVIAQGEEMQGKIKAVFPDKREFVVADMGGKNWNFQFAREGKVLINNRPGRLEDLLPGEQVSVIFERPVDMPEATEIRCSRDDLPRKIKAGVPTNPVK